MTNFSFTGQTSLEQHSNKETIDPHCCAKPRWRLSLWLCTTAQKLTNWIQFRTAKRTASQEKHPVKLIHRNLLYQTVGTGLKRTHKVCGERRKAIL